MTILQPSPRTDVDGLFRQFVERLSVEALESDEFMEAFVDYHLKAVPADTAENCWNEVRNIRAERFGFIAE